MTSTRRWATGSERGSALVLVPAGFLIVLILGALAVDSGVAYLGQRELAASAEAAANDAAGAALSDGAFYTRGRISVDPSEAARVVCQDIAAQDDTDLGEVSGALAVVGPAVFVELHAEVRAVFGQAIPGFGTRRVSAEGSAVAAPAGGVVSGPPPGGAAYQSLPCL